MNLGQSAKKKLPQARTNVGGDGIPVASLERNPQARNPSGFQPVQGKAPSSIGSDPTVYPNGSARGKQQTLLGVVPNNHSAQRPPPPSSRKTDGDIVTSAPSVHTAAAQPVRPPSASRQQTQLGIAPPPPSDELDEADLQTVQLKPPPQPVQERTPDMKPRGILQVAPESPKKPSSAPPRDRMPSDALGEQLTDAARKISVAPRSTTPPPGRLPSPPPTPAFEPPEAETHVFERQNPNDPDPNGDNATLHRPANKPVIPPAIHVQAAPKPLLVPRIAPPAPKPIFAPATNSMPAVPARSSNPPPRLQASTGRTVPPAGRQSQQSIPQEADVLQTIATCDMSLPAKLFDQLVRRIAPDQEMQAALKFQELYSASTSEKERARFMRAVGFIEGRAFERAQKTANATAPTSTEQAKPVAPKKPTDWGLAAAIGLNLLAFPAMFFPMLNIMEKGWGASVTIGLAAMLTLSLPIAIRNRKRAYGNKWFYHMIAVGIATVVMSVFAYRAKAISSSPQKPAATATAAKAKKPVAAKPVASVSADSESEDSDKEQ